MEQVKQKLRKLRLSGAEKALEERNEYAMKERIPYVEFLDLLLEDECVVRDSNAYQRRLTRSRLEEDKRLDNYDFSFQKEVDKATVMDLSSCRFVEEGRNVLFMGRPGVGKTHLANAIGLSALRKGYRVLMTHANEMIDKLHRSRADGSYGRALKKLINYEVLIIDELGFKKLPEGGAEDLFEIVRNRYEKSPTIITTNRDLEHWDQLLGDEVIASAMLDRLVHNAHLFKITGESYRLKDRKKKENEQNKKE